MCIHAVDSPQILQRKICASGEAGQYGQCAPPIDTKFEATFGTRGDWLRDRVWNCFTGFPIHTSIWDVCHV